MSRFFSNSRFYAATVFFLLGGPIVHAELIFNISSTGNADADAGFQEAASFWASNFDDNVTVNINAGFSALSGSTLASAQTTLSTYSYSAYRNALLADATSATDTTYVASMNPGNQYQAFANDPANGVTAGSLRSYSTIQLSHANAKAVGLRSATNTATDSSITFNSSFNFDFDRSDGIAAGMIDFVGVAIHELGHAMGFSGSTGVIASFGHVVDPSAIDLLRFSADSEAAGADLDLTGDNRAKYVSFDGGITPAAPGTDHWSRGGQFDGRQASHWRDDSFTGVTLGVMDPTLSSGAFANATTLDRQAFDAIGWDVSAVPEPSTGILTLLGIGVVGSRRRRTSPVRTR